VEHGDVVFVFFLSYFLPIAYNWYNYNTLTSPHPVYSSELTLGKSSFGVTTEDN